jgi:hypothetical protein
MGIAAAGGTTYALEGQILTVRVPMKFERIGGRKAIIAPEGAPDITRSSTAPDAALLRALGRAHRWQRLLEDGTYGSANQLAEAEKVNGSYLSRILRLTLLAPRTVEAILQGTQKEEILLAKLMEGFPVNWNEQALTNGRKDSCSPEKKLSGPP